MWIAAFYRWCGELRERLEPSRNVVVGVPGEDPGCAAGRAGPDREKRDAGHQYQSQRPFGKEGGWINWLIENPRNQGKH